MEISKTRKSHSAPKALETRIINDPLHWKAIAATWDRVFQNPMQSYAWSSAWWKHFKSESPAKLAILVVSENDRDVAIAPLYVERTKFGNTVKLLGSGEVCSDYLDLGIDYLKEAKSDVEGSTQVRNWVHALADFVRSTHFTDQFGLVDCIELEGYSDKQTALAEFSKAIKDQHWGCEDIELEGCWITEFADSWPDYELKLSKSRRRKVRKALKWIDSQDLTWNKIETTKELENIWPDVVRLHQQRRGMLGQAGCFATEKFNGFLFEAFQQLVSEKRAFVATLTDTDNDHSVIAVLLVLKCEAGWQIYQSGADPNAMGREPGHTLNAIVLREAFETGVGSMDFLRGDEPYKEGWYAKRIPLNRTRLFGTHLSARLRFHALRVHRQWKNWTNASQTKATKGANHG